MIPRCERCDARLETRGDHLCTPCAAATDRGTRDPYWGDFPNHPDSALLPVLPLLKQTP